MNTVYYVNMHAPHSHDAFKTLESLPGLSLRHDREANHLDVASAAGATRYHLQRKATVTTTTLPALVERLAFADERRPLLLAPYLTPAVTDRLTREGIDFADAAGNIRLDGPAAYVLVLGRTLEEPPIGTGLSPTDLQLVFALLARPALRRATYRDLHEGTGVSLGAISNGIRRLQEMGYVRRHAKSVVLRHPSELLERWEYGYLEKLRPRLHPTAYRFGKDATLESVVAAAADMKGVRIGGEVAADLMTRHLRPSTLTLHVAAGHVVDVARALRLPPSRTGEGSLNLLERFAPGVDAYRGQATPGHRLIHPILVRAELLALDDARLRSVAQRLLHDIVLPEVKDAG